MLTESPDDLRSGESGGVANQKQIFKLVRDWLWSKNENQAG